MKKGLLLLASVVAAALMPICVAAQDEAPVASPGYLDCNGSNRYMLIPNDETAFGIAADGARTISLKAKVAVNPGSYSLFSTRVRKSGNDTTGACIYTLISGSTKATSVSANFPSSSSWTAFHSNRWSEMTTDEGWVYLCWTYSATDETSHFYIIDEATEVDADGISDYDYTATHSTGVEMPSYCDPIVGANYTMSNSQWSVSNLTQFFNGAIDDVRMYDGFFSAEEVLADRSSEKPLEIEGKSVIAAYNFDEIEGATVKDISGNEHDGTLYNFPTYFIPVYYTVNITAPADDANGSFVVYNGEEVVEDGASLLEGTELKIVATPEFGYKLSTVKVNDEAIEANEDGEYVYTVAADATISVEFEAITYEAVNQTTTQTGRYITSVTLTDAKGNTGAVAGGGSTRNRKVYLDNTSTIVDINRGVDVNISVVGGGEWMHEYLFIDYNADGVFTPAIEDNKVTKDSELVSYNLYSSDNGNSWYNSLGVQNTAEKANYASINGPSPAFPAFKIPENIAPGKYRARFLLSWNTIDATGTNTFDGNTLGTNGGAIIDFVINVTLPTRTVSVANSNEELGAVAITDSEETSITTSDAVEVVAKPVDPAKFYNWTDGDGAEVSKDATYSYTGADDITLTANYGYEVSVDAKHATVTFADEEGNAIEGNIIPVGAKVVATVTPEDDMLFTSFAVADDEEAALSEDNTYEFTADKPYSISVVYTPKWDHADGNITSSYASSRYITSIKISDEKGNSYTVYGPGNDGAIRPVYSDQVDVVIETIAGQKLTFEPTGSGEWQQTYVYLDKNNDGLFTTDFDENGAVTEDSELLSSNGYRFDGTNWIDSKGEACASNRGDLYYNSAIPDVVIPADLPEGTYRMRYKGDWDCTDAYGNTASNNLIQANAGTIIDFTLKIRNSKHNVAVKSSNDNYGIAFISTEETKEIETDESATLIARATEPAEFMGWYDADDNLVSKDGEYAYDGIFDINYTAKFGFEITYSATDHGGIVVETDDEETVKSGDILLGDTYVLVLVEADSGYVVSSFTVNGYDTELDEDGVCELKMNNKYDVKVEFDTESGVESIAVAAQDTEAEYFDLTGARVNSKNLTPGIYIRRSAQKAQKVIIK
jgi:hypothetical protein